MHLKSLHNYIYLYRVIHERGTSELFLLQPTIPMALSTKSNMYIISFNLEIKASWVDLLDMSDWQITCTY
jgi:hypothetical protein